ncbi:monocarboxylate transporter 14-like [Colias croceus]|uniref:monocarboxylate transporter 14-like n=1 Tax=Colias crocea TaxID=72248 RepID=UPI001E27B791|nr:monocarboxylate transporter 14-like [Colias croceus]
MVGNESYKPNGEAHIENGNDLKHDIDKINSLKSKENNEIVAHYLNEGSPPVERVKFEGLDDDSIYSHETDENKLPPIPDGGWGWVVVFAAFLVSACADGLAYSFGILHEEFTNYFEASQSKTSLIGSLFISIPLISGPIMSALVDRYGCRTMTMIAGVLSTIGFLLAAISDSIVMLCFTLGTLSGLAMGILYVTSVVSVAFWFDKRRTLAVSLASCGIGFGTLIYSPLTNFFIELYDWRNTLVLLAGTILNMCVCGALMRDPDWLIIKEARERKQAKSQRSRRPSSAGSISSKSLGGESAFLSADELNDLLKSGQSPEYILATLTTTLAEAEQLEATTQMNAEQSRKRTHSAIQLPTFIQRHDEVPTEVIEKLMSNKRLYNIILQNYPHLITRRRSEVNLHVDNVDTSNLPEPATMKVTVIAKRPKQPEDAKNKKPNDVTDSADKAKPHEDSHTLKHNSRSETKMSSTHHGKDHSHLKPEIKHAHHREQLRQVPTTASWLSRQIYTDHHYLRDMPLMKSTIMHRGAMMNIPRYKLRASSLPDIYKNSSWSIYSYYSDDERKWYDRVLDTIKSTFDMRMFVEFHFIMFNIGSLILFVWAIIPYFFLKSYMTTVDMEGGAMMISIIGIASGVGIVGLGWAGDQPWINVTKTYAICLIVCGISVAAYPLFITNYWGLVVISTIFGLSYASSYSYTPAILMELMPIDYFTIAYGFILLSQGVGHLIGPPLGGLLYDVTGSWELTFYAGGVWLVISGISIGIIPYTKNRRIWGSGALLKDTEEGESKHSVKV